MLVEASVGRIWPKLHSTKNTAHAVPISSTKFSHNSFTCFRQICEGRPGRVPSI